MKNFFPSQQNPLKSQSSPPIFFFFFLKNIIYNKPIQLQMEPLFWQREETLGGKNWQNIYIDDQNNWLFKKKKKKNLNPITLLPFIIVQIFGCGDWKWEQHSVFINLFQFVIFKIFSTEGEKKTKNKKLFLFPFETLKMYKICRE